MSAQNLIPVEGFIGFFVKPLTAGPYMRIRRTALDATQREEDPLDAESASVLAAALHCGMTADGVPIWDSLEAVECERRVRLVDQIGQQAIAALEEPEEGN